MDPAPAVALALVARVRRHPRTTPRPPRAHVTATAPTTRTGGWRASLPEHRPAPPACARRTLPRKSSTSITQLRSPNQPYTAPRNKNGGFRLTNSHPQDVRTNVNGHLVRPSDGPAQRTSRRPHGHRVSATTGEANRRSLSKLRPRSCPAHWSHIHPAFLGERSLFQASRIHRSWQSPPPNV